MHEVEVIRISIEWGLSRWADRGAMVPQKRGPTGTWAVALPGGSLAAAVWLSRMHWRIAAAGTTLVPHGRRQLKNRHL